MDPMGFEPISTACKAIILPSELRAKVFKRFNPATGSPTATVLRLRLSHQPGPENCSAHPKPPKRGGSTGFAKRLLKPNQLPWRDGRCVQDLLTYSPQLDDLRLLAIPPLCVSFKTQSELRQVFVDCSPSRTSITSVTAIVARVSPNP
jgi:hypothetical protein